MIPLPILQEIIKDTTAETSTLKRIGITGSYSRGDFSERSDIDLVFDINDLSMDDSVLKAGMSMKSIIGDQFGHDVDITIYTAIVGQLGQKGNPVVLSGYKQMLKDLKWIWRSDE